MKDKIDHQNIKEDMKFSYYPDINIQRKQLNKRKKGLSKWISNSPAKTFTGLMFKPGMLFKTDGASAEDIDGIIKYHEERRDIAKSKEEYKYFDALMERGESLSDLTTNLYYRLDKNPESMSNWFPQLQDTYSKSNHFFKIPDTKIWTLPIELAQYIRIEYTDTNEQSRELFNKIIFDHFELDENKTYFIKTGVFSSKFEFRNVHCTEPREMGDYFSVVNNFAMTVGAGRSIDLVVREWIDDVENRPTIYNGMPLRTEFRAFVDLDNKEIIDIVPYWNPIVMNRVLQSQGKNNPKIKKDYLTYQSVEQELLDDYNEHVGEVKNNLSQIIENLDLKGKWSLDIMKNGKDFYLIDMARMEKSALTELINKNKKELFING